LKIINKCAALSYQKAYQKPIIKLLVLMATIIRKPKVIEIIKEKQSMKHLNEII
jgi:hypothetical protein